MRFSSFEIKELVKAWLIVSLAFAIAFVGLKSSLQIMIALGISMFTVGTGFLLHELAHKFVAQKYGCWAEFRANNFMLGVALFSSLFGFIFAAPGAVMISGHVTKERNGKISVAGPLMNVFLAIVFLAFYFLIPLQFAKTVSFYGFLINSWLALFNMLPFSVLDGNKVLAWNKKVYGVVLGVSILLVFGQGLLGAA